ncbi:glutamate synthase subunit alpha, partial [bacterium]|nr:glutamate synthase subunit alpha [bacterium]
TFDNVLELLVRAGRSIPHAMMMMIPEAWGSRFLMSEDKRAFYEYHASMMEPWDGPASITFTDGQRFIGAVLDRNGLRPSRYTVTRDGLVVLASETGVLEIPEDQIQRRGRLQPGRMFLVDLYQNRIVSDTELKGKIARRKPYRHWVNENRIDLRGLQAPPQVETVETDILRSKQHAFGYTEEELKMIIGPMATRGQEPIGSMGNDTALAVLSDQSQLLFSYFKQLFAQVTNPPIDPLREELVMSLMGFVGRQYNVLEETPRHFRRLKLPHPILTPEDLDKLREASHPDVVVREIDTLFPSDGDGKALEEAMDRICQEAEQHIAEGATILVLTDRHLDADLAPVPSLLATAGLHHHLIRRKLRTSAGIIVDSGEPREIMHFALLIGYGASAVCPRTAFSTVYDMARGDMLEESLTPEATADNFISAIKKGLLKTFSRMGISTIRSYHGAQIFEAVGLSRKLVDKYFTHTPSRIEGIGLDEIAVETLSRHRRGYPKYGESDPLLAIGGNYHIRMGGERHQWTPEAIYLLQTATRLNDYKLFKQFAELENEHASRNAALRGLIRFKEAEPIPLDEVEPVEAITRRFVTAAMSYGSISKEAHESIAIALNRLGGRSNSGEGGEDPARYIPLPNGDSKRSRIKQVASGRFGVTTEYLVNADELQIKIAQGAKPGEGGQIPGHKVSEDIARVRPTTPGV